MNQMGTPLQSQNTPLTSMGGNLPSTHLPAQKLNSSERWQAAGRAAWWPVALTVVVLFIASIPVGYNRLRTVCPQASCDYQLNTVHVQQLQNLGISLDSFAFFISALFALVAGFYVAVAFILYRRRVSGWIGLLGAYTLVVFGTMTAFQAPDLIAQGYPSLRLLAKFLEYAGGILLPLFVIVFPDGRLKPRWTIGLVAAWAIFLFPAFFFPESPLNPDHWPFRVQALIWLGFIGSLIGVLYSHYRRLSEPVMRQQAKWVVYGLMVALGGFFLVRTFFALIDPLVLKQVMLVIVDTVVECLLWLIIPLSFAIAILRYKLWEIDLLISRTMVYVPLTAILTGLYSASISLFQKIFIATTGEKSDAALVMTTFVLVSTFTPIKSGLQMVVDKQFKETFDPLKEIHALDEQVRSIVEVLDARLITHRLLQTAINAFYATGGAVYLQQGGRSELAHASPGWEEEDGKLSLPLEWNGRQLGLLCLGARMTGVEYSDQERQALQQAANRVARAMAGFTAEE